jgi:hypothetical protein
MTGHLKLEFSISLCWLGGERKRMKAVDFLDMQKAYILKRGEGGMLAAEIWR